MASDRSFQVDRHTRRFTPFIGHWTGTIGVNQDGSVFVMGHYAGFAAELVGPRATRAPQLSINQVTREIANPRIEVWDHFVRQDRQAMSPLPEVDNWFAARFDEAYRATQGDGKLFRNDHFLTIVMHPDQGLRGDFRAMAGGTRQNPEPDDTMIQELETVLARIEAVFARYGFRRLGVRERDGVVFSEIAEALHLIANGKFRPIGLIDGRLGRLVVPDRIVFGHRDFQIMGEGEPVFGAVVTLLHYPARTSPTMFTALRRAPFPMTITNAIYWLRVSGLAGPGRI